MACRTIDIFVQDMHCTNCEIRIEKQLNKLEGIVYVKASYSRSKVTVTYNTEILSIEQILKGIEDAGYQGALAGEKVTGTRTKDTVKDKNTQSNKSSKKMDNIKLMGIGVIILAVYLIIQNTIGFNYIPAVQQNAGYGLLFIVGILTSLHCIAMCGGIAISQSIKKDTACGSSKKYDKFKPAALYNLGRLISYTVLGGIVGGLGSVISLSGRFRGVVAILAGAFMIIMGINMLNIFPWLRKINIRMPKIFGKKLTSDKRSKSPFIVGLLNGFMPCGPLQTMQLYALGTGSIFTGAASMFVFALGTMPLMTIFSFIASLLSSKFTSRMLKVSAVVVIILGLVMTNRGLALSGVAMPDLSFLGGTQANAATVKAENVDGKQVLKMSANASGYSPNVFFVQKGIPVRWIISGDSLNSCNNEIVVPEYNIQQKLKPGENIIEFTPESIGSISFSCWMGMIRGTFKVVDDVSKITEQDRQNEQQNNPQQSGGGGCCGAGAIVQGPITENDIVFAANSGSKQTATMNVDGKGYNPRVLVFQKDSKSASFIIKAKDLNACNNVIVFPEVGYQKQLKEGDNTIDFNPSQSAVLGFSCTMGMLYGDLVVVDDLKKVTKQDILKLLEQAPQPSGGGCCS